MIYFHRILIAVMRTHISHYSPSKSTALHFIRQRYIIAPDIKLPFSQTENTAEHITAVHANPHIDVTASGFPYNPVGWKTWEKRKWRRWKRTDVLQSTEMEFKLAFAIVCEEISSNEVQCIQNDLSEFLQLKLKTGRKKFPHCFSSFYLALQAGRERFNCSTDTMWNEEKRGKNEKENIILCGVYFMAKFVTKRKKWKLQNCIFLSTSWWKFCIFIKNSIKLLLKLKMSIFYL